MAKNCPRVVLYDFDGTIADSLDATVKIYNRLAKMHGFKMITKDNLQSLRAKGPKEIFKELNIPLFKVPSIALKALKESKETVSELPLHSGMRELFANVAATGYAQGILSSNLEANVQAFLQKNDIDTFDFIYCDEGFQGKAKLLKKCLKERSLSPKDIVYVGDEVRDIEAAHEAGVRMIAVDWGYNSSGALERKAPYAVVSSPQELLEILSTPML